jgi:hypothetical protein
MEWFKHDTSATTDAKIKKLVIRYGATGYAIYFHCLELIAGNISQTNLTFQLEHDSEIIADNLKIHGTSERSGQEIVEEIMRYMVELKLFDNIGDKIYCFKLLNRLDSSMTGSTKFRKMITEAKEHHDNVMTMSCKNRIEENRIEEKREYADGVYLTETEYNKLLKLYEKSDVESKMLRLASYLVEKGKEYKSHYLTLRNWLKDDCKQKPQQKRCPECGEVMHGAGCSCGYAEAV